MSATSRRATRDAWIAVAVAVVAAILTYALSVQNGFAYDDEPMLRENRLIHALGDLPDALARPYWLQYGTLYRPLTTLAFGIDWAIGGGAPWIYHAFNIGWHALCAALIVRLALRWLPPVAARRRSLLAMAGFTSFMKPSISRMETGIISTDSSCSTRRFSATSGRSCSLASSAFFI